MGDIGMVLVVCCCLNFGDFCICECVSRIVLVRVVLIKNGMCQFYVFSCGVFNNVMVNVDSFIVSSVFILLVVDVSEVINFCCCGGVDFSRQVIMLVYLLLIENVIRQCSSSNSILVVVFSVVNVGNSVVVSMVMVISSIEVSIIMCCLKWLLRWLKYSVFSGCIRQDMVNLVRVVSNVCLLFLKNICDIIVVRYRYSVKLYYFIIVDRLVISIECECLVGVVGMLLIIGLVLCMWLGFMIGIWLVSLWYWVFMLCYFGLDYGGYIVSLVGVVQQMVMFWGIVFVFEQVVFFVDCIFL